MTCIATAATATMTTTASNPHSQEASFARRVRGARCAPRLSSLGGMSSKRSLG
ncbi:hypothetical protein ACFPRL_26360 [Pseudoclavibacter helvolus]